MTILFADQRLAALEPFRAGSTSDARGLKILSLASGGFVAAWQSGNGLYARMFDRHGAPLGEVFLLPRSAASAHSNLALAPLANGGFVATWERFVGPNFQVEYRGFDASGAPLGIERAVSASPAQQPAVALLEGGGFVIAFNAFDGDSGGIRAQRFTAGGAKVGAEMWVNATSAGDQHFPLTTALPGGGFLVTWFDSSLIRGQIYDSAGQKVGGAIDLAPADIWAPALATLSTGNVLLAYVVNGDLKAKILSPGGAVLVPEFQVTTSVSGTQYMPSITVLASGEFLITWRDATGQVGYTQDGEVRGQLFAADSTKIGDEFLVNTVTAGGQTEPVSTVFGSGDVATLWIDYSGGFSPVIEARLLFSTRRGTAGSEAIAGTGDRDFLFGLGGADTLTGGDAADELDGGDGDDLLAGGTGDDLYAGGEGTDTLDFSGEPGPVIVNLSSSLSLFAGTHPLGTRPVAPGEALDSYGHYESLSGIENLILTAGDDVAAGSAEANRIEAGGGNDVVTAGNGGDVVLGGSGDDEISGEGGDDNLDGGDGSDVLLGDAGADTISGGDGDDFALGGADNDSMSGGAGDDILRGEDGTDTLAGGTGNDLLRGGPGVDSFDGGTGGEIFLGDLGEYGDRVSFFEARATQGVVADLRTGIISNDGFGNTETMMNIESLGADTAFVDTFFGNDGRNFLAAGLGDYLYGFGDDDWLALTGAAALVDGGGGGDLLELNAGGGGYRPDSNGDGNAELSPAMAGGYAVDLVNGTLRDGDGNVGAVAGIEHILGSELADELRGNGASNALTGRGGNDFLLLQDGGDDVVGGNEGNDVLYFGAAFTPDDVANGGAGRDALVLQGNYALVFDADSMFEMEAVSLQSGATTKFGDLADNFYDFNLTMADANVPAGVQMIINGQSLRAGEDLTFDGSAETDGKFLIYAGHGTDILKGGAGVDVFFFEGDRWGPNDRVDGGGGRDSVVISGGTGLKHVEFGADSLTNIESISVNATLASDRSAKPSYELVLHNGNVTAGGNLIVNGNSLADPTQTLSVDGSAVVGGTLTMFGGAGNDTLIGGAGGDLLYGGGGKDNLTGNSGVDLFQWRSPSESSLANPDAVLDFQPGTDKIHLLNMDANPALAGDQAFTFIGSSAFNGTAGQLRTYESGGTWIVEGDTDGNGAADFAIAVTSQGGAALGQGDFIL